MVSDHIRSVPDRIGRVLYVVLAVSTVGALVLGVTEASAAGPDTVRVQWWRTLAYVVFIAAFALLAARPRSCPGLCEAVVFQKAGIAVIGFLDITAAESADRSPVDLTVAVVTMVAWVLTRGWSAWSRETRRSGSAPQTAAR